MPSSTSGRKSLLQRLDDRNQRWAERLHPEVTVHSSVYGLLSIRLLLPQRHEGQQVGQLWSIFGRTKWDRTTAPGEELRAHILGSFFALRSPQSVPGHNHRIFVVVVSSLGGDQIGLLSRSGGSISPKGKRVSSNSGSISRPVVSLLPRPRGDIGGGGVVPCARWRSWSRAKL